ncbi:methyltransferase domain-containing protein [candidate division KSB1 bacterium]|nr:methyltransferase domain-containing protein [candidate division KSB1 bacterium]
MSSQSTSPHPERSRWNEKHTTRLEKGHDSEPAELLVNHESLLFSHPKGRALDLACGTGRNAIYLAKLGFQVDAVDISDVALHWLRKQVRRLNLAVHPIQMNLEAAHLPKETYQLIVNVNYLERSLFQSIRQALLPNGLLFFEAFTRDHMEKLGNQINPNFTLERGELLSVFSDLEILYYKEKIIAPKTPDRKRAVARLIARNEC